MPLSKKNQKHQLIWKFWTKKWSPRFLECAEHHVFILSKKTVFDGVSGFFDEGMI